MKAPILAICSAFVLSGCAGLAAPFINNPYAATYDGTYTSTTGDKGTATMQLTTLGNVFGTLNDTTSGKTGSITGSVGSGLTMNGTITFPGASAVSVTGLLTADHNIITGTLKGTPYSISIVMTKE